MFYFLSQQNLLLGLSGNSPGASALDSELNRRLMSSGANSSTAQSPGLNLSSHSAATEDESLSPAFAANILDLKEAIGGNNGKCVCVQNYC